MITSKGWLSLLVLVFLVTPCNARLGETADQLKARFGDSAYSSQPDAAGVTRVTYNKDGFQIEVWMYEDISQCEEYSPENGAFSDPEIQVLLSDEADGQDWKPDPSNLNRKWVRTDKSIAFYEPENNHVLTFTSAEFLASQADRNKKISDAKEAAKINTLNTF